MQDVAQSSFRGCPNVPEQATASGKRRCTICQASDRKSATEQQTFSLGEEDRGRFKDTEPSIVQGEDLDVPTWMRLKKKLRR